MSGIEEKTGVSTVVIYVVMSVLVYVGACG